MVPDGLATHLKASSNLFIRKPECHQLQDLQLTVGQCSFFDSDTVWFYVFRQL